MTDQQSLEQELNHTAKTALLKQIKRAEEFGRPEVSNFYYDILLVQKTLEQLKTQKLRDFFSTVTTLAACEVEQFILLAKFATHLLYDTAEKKLGNIS